MQSRMDKYYGKVTDDTLEKPREVDELEKTTSLSRVDRNKQLYQDVSNQDLEEFDVNSNASVIGRGNEINIESIREMLDKKYRELPKNKSMSSMNEPEIGRVNLAETREFDINTVLEKAHQEKEVNYEEERLKKIRNTQYDILKNLDVVKEAEKEKEDGEYKKGKLSKHEEEVKLKELIDTITAKELITEEMEATEETEGDLDPLDLLTDLRGDDENTRVMGALTQETILDEELIQKQDTKGIEIEEEEEEKELEIKPIEISDEEIETKVNLILEEKRKNNGEVEEEKKEEKLEEKDTDTINFTQNDFDDFSDLKEDMKITKTILRVLIFVIIVAFIIGMIVLANKLFGLGLF